jgi:hypothetical protein
MEPSPRASDWAAAEVDESNLAVAIAATVYRHRKRKKADVAEHPEAFGHVGLLRNEPPGAAGLPFS